MDGDDITANKGEADKDKQDVTKFKPDCPGKNYKSYPQTAWQIPQETTLLRVFSVIGMWGTSSLRSLVI